MCGQSLDRRNENDKHGKRDRQQISPDKALQRTGSRLVAALVAALALVLGDTGLIGAVCGGVTSLVLTVTAVVAARVYADTASSITLGCTAVPLAFVSGALCVPGTVLSAHLLLGSAFAAAVT
ncbi:hypothetical protein ABT116_45235, partial [Streptomyces sp. NPDC002130]